LHKSLGELILIDRVSHATSACGVIKKANDEKTGSTWGSAHQGESAEDAYPKYKAGAEKMHRSDRTNAIHMEIITLAEKIIALSLEGTEDNLDSNCLDAFTQAKDEAWGIKQRCKTELIEHMKLGKY
jgi:hypothetical protein